MKVMNHTLFIYILTYMLLPVMRWLGYNWDATACDPTAIRPPRDFRAPNGSRIILRGSRITVASQLLYSMTFMSSMTVTLIYRSVRTVAYK